MKWFLCSSSLITLHRYGISSRVRSATALMDTSRIFIRLISPATAALLPLEVAIEQLDFGTLRRASAPASSLLKMALPLLPSLPTLKASPLVLWTRLFAFGTFLDSSLSSVLRDLTDTKTLSTQSRSLPMAKSLSVAHWIALSRCGSLETLVVALAWCLPEPASASKLLKVTVTLSCLLPFPLMLTGSSPDLRTVVSSSGIPERALRSSCSRVTRTPSSLSHLAPRVAISRLDLVT